MERLVVRNGVRRRMHVAALVDRDREVGHGAPGFAPVLKLVYVVLEEAESRLPEASDLRILLLFLSLSLSLFLFLFFVLVLLLLL